ncbi:uncharacterized protein K460DRAFT_394231 [Cucurbitaria berberidis CBS 394.84]|uniref:Uncharacterized protein n=1 Tax=Cucurbitaria berberidis CBS 394.84 TaxID=1168544 RepID=A0A9P4GPW6_9PLEO|nr:uncharacterized protein K460DRAFT_394231 [Cucurbitaria berberidis CBS 394.84]KAF1849389.1 hypothetical protein K460DRAFT_394231 [Cucurbitaria berberidis CBS 394.84]
MALTPAQTKHNTLGENLSNRSHDAFNSLSDELLLMITREVDEASETRHPLHALCAVNRRFNRLAVPLLYREYCFDHYDCGVHSRFIRTLQAAPALGKLVIRVTVAHQTLKLDNVSEAVEEIPWLDMLQAEPKTGMIRADPFEACIALTICLTPNIKHLDVYNYYYGDQDVAPPKYLEPLRAASSNEPDPKAHTFAHLTSATVYISSMFPGEVSSVFCLPSLRSVHIHGTKLRSRLSSRSSQRARDSSPIIQGYWQCPPGSSKVKELHVSGVFASAVLSIMIGSVSSLQRFCCSGEVYLEQEPDWFSKVGNALLQHQSSLLSLSFNNINCDTWDSNNLHWPTDRLSVPDQLCMVKSLQSLHTYVGLLVPLLPSNLQHSPDQLAALTTVLPPTLELLLLEVPPDWSPHQFLDVHDPEAWKVFPNLKRLYLRYQFVILDDVLPTDAFLELEAYFKRTEVDFAFRIDYHYCVVHRPPDQSHYDACVEALGKLGPAAAKIVGHGRPYRAMDWPNPAGLICDCFDTNGMRD